MEQTEVFLFSFVCPVSERILCSVQERALAPARDQLLVVEDGASGGSELSCDKSTAKKKTDIKKLQELRPCFVANR